MGLGLAIKCDDGAGRAAEAITAAMIVRFLDLAPADRMFCESYLRPTLCNWSRRTHARCGGRSLDVAGFSCSATHGVGL